MQLSYGEIDGEAYRSRTYNTGSRNPLRQRLLVGVSGIDPANSFIIT